MHTPRIKDSFEDAAGLSDWRDTGEGALELSPRHAKDGAQALCWSWKGHSRLRRKGLALEAGVAASGGIKGWIYLEKPLPGRLTFRLGTAAEVAAGEAPYAFRFGLDFTGWRMFRVLFERDCRERKSEVGSQKSEAGDRSSTSSGQRRSEVAIECLEIEAPTEAPEGRLWLDALVIGTGVSADRTADYQVPEHEADRGNWCAHWPLYYARQAPSEPLPEAVTGDQKRDFATLFQCWMPEEGMPVEVNGERVDAFPYRYDGEAGHALTLRDPYGHGYVLPDGSGVRLERGVQHSRDAWNRGDTEGAFSTAWIDHGKGPLEDGYGGPRYHYAMLVHATPERLAGVAGNPPYRVLQQDHQAHVVELGRTTAYALFETDWIVPHGLVRRTDAPVLVMVRGREDGSVTLSVADPDLRLPKRRNMMYLDHEANATEARPSQVRLQVRGQWRLGDSPDNVSVEISADEYTTLLFTCAYGLTSEVRLVRG